MWTAKGDCPFCGTRMVAEVGARCPRPGCGFTVTRDLMEDYGQWDSLDHLASLQRSIARYRFVIREAWKATGLRDFLARTMPRGKDHE